MAKAYNERCIVLRHTKLGETDVIVTMLASDGSQVRAVAKGLRKPGNRIGARLELFLPRTRRSATSSNAPRAPVSPPNSSRSSDVTASCWVSACTR